MTGIAACRFLPAVDPEPSPVVLTTLAHPWRHGALIRILTWREISGRYRGSLFGSFWSLLTPLLMLGVYTLVFGVILPSRWPGAEGQGIGMFALRLLAGMVVHGLFGEALGRAPMLVTSQPNYVTKVVFPLEALGWVNLLTALFHTLMALLVLVLLNGLFGTGFSATQLALPLLLLPYAALLLGLVWLIAALARPRQYLLIEQPVDPGRGLHRGQPHHVLVRRGHVRPHHRQAELAAEHLQQVVLADRANPHQHAADPPADLLLQGQPALEVGGADQAGIEQKLAQQAVARRNPQCGVRGHRRILS